MLNSTLYIHIQFVPHREQTMLMMCSGTCLLIVGAVRNVLRHFDWMFWFGWWKLHLLHWALCRLDWILCLVEGKDLPGCFIFSIKRYKKLGPEDEGNTVPGNVDNHLLICTVSHLRRTESSAAPL